MIWQCHLTLFVVPQIICHVRCFFQVPYFLQSYVGDGMRVSSYSNLLLSLVDLNICLFAMLSVVADYSVSRRDLVSTSCFLPLASHTQKWIHICCHVTILWLIVLPISSIILYRIQIGLSFVSLNICVSFSIYSYPLCVFEKFKWPFLDIITIST